MPDDEVKIPHEVEVALKTWLRRAVRYDPNKPSQTASNSAKAAWVEFENKCLEWEREERTRRNPIFSPSGLFGPTGRHRA